MAKRRKKRRSSVRGIAGIGAIKKGTCKIVRGRVRVCKAKSGSITVRATGVKRKSTKSYKKPAAPSVCKTKPTVRKGRCSCKTKSTGANRFLKMRFCRKPKN